MSNENEAKFHMEQVLARASNAASSDEFDEKLQKLVDEYGGGDKIPGDKIGEILGPMSDEFGKVLLLCAHVQDFGKTFGKNFLEYTFSKMLGRYIHANSPNPEEAKVVQDVINADHSRTAAWDKMAALGDITADEIYTVFAGDKAALSAYLEIPE
jgi:hypothetical protein